MQKRIVMVLIVLLALTAGAFALEESQAAARAHSFAFTANASTTTVIFPAQDASLFAGLEGTELSGDEMMMVEGEGPFVRPTSIGLDGCAQMGTPDPIIMNKLAKQCRLLQAETFKTVR